jgi:phospholipase/carboxylesterase
MKACSRIDPQIAPSQQLAGLHASISHGVNDSKLTVEFARSAQKFLSEKSVALTCQEYSAGHEFNAAMLRNFN